GDEGAHYSIFMSRVDRAPRSEATSRGRSIRSFKLSRAGHQSYALAMLHAASLATSSCSSPRPRLSITLSRQGRAHVLIGRTAVRVVPHVLPRALGHLARGPHDFPVHADHVDRDDSIDVPLAVELDHTHALLEHHLHPGEVVGERF